MNLVLAMFKNKKQKQKTHTHTHTHPTHTHTPPPHTQNTQKITCFKTNSQYCESFIHTRICNKKEKKKERKKKKNTCYSQNYIVLCNDFVLLHALITVFKRHHTHRCDRLVFRGFLCSPKVL